MSNNIIQINSNLFVERYFLSFLFNSNNKICKLILSEETLDGIFYLQNSQNLDMVSYIPSSKIDFDLNFNPNDYKIQSMKIGRIISKLFSKETLESHSIKQSDIEEFVNSYKSWVDKNKLTFRIVEGEEIRKWYDQENYSIISKGTLWNSCMRHKERLAYLDLYCENKNIKMLILTCDDNGKEKLRGRALLWDDVILNDFYNKIPGDIKVMDRIYSILDSDAILFKEWAYENGYIHKLEQNSKSHLYFSNKSEVLKLSLKIKLDKTSFGYYPYLDTFPFFSENKGYLTNDEYNLSWNYKIAHTRGTLEEDHEDQEGHEEYYDEEEN